MSLKLRPGIRLFSTVDAAEFVVVKAPAELAQLTIGGAPGVLSRDGSGSGEILPGHDGGVAVGKRYTDADGTIELLCTKAGQGVPAVDGTLLGLKEAKPLPASD